jgi:small subunit ribosomal protein S3
MLCQYIGRKIQQRVAPTSIFAKVMTIVPQRNPNIIGMRLQCNGRPTGNTIASSKWVQHGKIPIHSYKYKTDYSFQSTITKHGLCGIKVWLCHR